MQNKWFDNKTYQLTTNIVQLGMMELLRGMQGLSLNVQYAI